MFDLTGLDPFDWIASFLALLGLGMIVVGLRRIGGPKSGAVPMLVGGALVSVLAALPEPSRFWVAGGQSLTTLPGALVTLGLVAVAVSFVSLAVHLLAWSDHRGGWTEKAAPWVIALLAVVVALGPVIARDRISGLRASSATGDQSLAPEDEALTVPPFSLGWSIRLPGNPLGVAFHADTSALYITVGQGQVLRVPIDQDGGAVGEPETVIDGLVFPRGVVTVGDRLFVAEVGDLPCESSFPRCKGEDVPGHATQASGEVQILEESDARVTEFRLNPDGSLERVGVVVEGLPVGNTDHAVNGMVAGPDGMLYLSIGNIDRLVFDREAFGSADHPKKELLGTIIRLDPSNGSFEVVARGTRNVYGLALDPTGTLWGADNDGPSFAGHRFEEVLRIADGAHFGFPEDGSSPPFKLRTEAASYQLPPDVVGSGGIAWIDVGDGRSGFLLGSAGRVSFLDVALVDGAHRVRNKVAHDRVMTGTGWVVDIEAISPTEVVVAEYTSNRLTLLRWVPTEP